MLRQGRTSTVDATHQGQDILRQEEGAVTVLIFYTYFFLGSLFIRLPSGMSIMRACLVGILVMMISLTLQRLRPEYLEAPFTAFALSLLFAGGVEMQQYAAWPVLALAYLTPSFLCGLLAACMVLVYDAAAVARRRRD